MLLFKEISLAIFLLSKTLLPSLSSGKMKLLNMKSIKFLKKEDQLSSLGDLLSARQLGCPSVPLRLG